MSDIIFVPEKLIPATMGRPFYHKRLPESLRLAQEYAGKDGHVATMPELLRARILSPGDEELWRKIYDTFSEEGVGRTGQGNEIAYVGHGGMILSTPQRIINAYNEGLIDGAARTGREFADLMEGKTPNGEVTVYTLKEFMGMDPSKLPARYLIVTDLDDFSRLDSGPEDIEALKENPLFIARAGGRDTAVPYLDEAGRVYETSRYSNWHRFRSVNPDTPQSWLIVLDDFVYRGLRGFLDDDGRFAGVRAPDLSE